MDLEEKTLSKEYAFKGRIINLRVDKVELPDGSVSTREIVEHNGGIGVLPIDDEMNVYVVKQWRSPYKRVVLEIPAGKRDGDEKPLDCGIRELKEEIGAVANEYTYLGELLPSPGYCGEIIYIYLARGLTFENQKLDEGEFLNVEKMPFKKLVEMVMNGEVCDTKTQIAVLKADKLLNQK
ncbi:MAG: NUDIX hydrolase [Clostridia bacterium]|nr:NUDIX hydrolase [Clostridia bacterium]